jgi:aromatic ring-opening dioxygenase catalytic subunit (LigB family)
MAELCLGLTTSHQTFIIDGQHLGDPDQVAQFRDGYARLARELAEAKPDVLLIVSAEHVNKFFLDNMPAFCIGMFDEFSGPAEARSRDPGYPYRTVPSDYELARYLVERGLDEGVDWAVTENWELDHGFMVPLQMIDPEGRVPVIPIFVNCAAPPLPSPRRCYNVGRWLGQAIARWPSSKRVALIATGGLSHSVGTPETGYIDVDFDERFLDAFCANRGDELMGLTDEEINASGGAFEGKAAERVFYAPIEGFLTGCGQCVVR